MYIRITPERRPLHRSKKEERNWNGVEERKEKEGEKLMSGIG